MNIKDAGWHLGLYLQQHGWDLSAASFLSPPQPAPSEVETVRNAGLIPEWHKTVGKELLSGCTSSELQMRTWQKLAGGGSMRALKIIDNLLLPIIPWLVGKHIAGYHGAFSTRHLRLDICMEF